MFRTFSPTLSRIEYIERLHSYSEEFAHNIMRIILRPNNPSVNHWFRELMPWTIKAIQANINPKFREVGHLFNDFGDVTKSGMVWHEGYTLATRDIVEGENSYGTYLSYNFYELKVLIQLLYDKLSELSKESRASDIKSKYLEWYKLLPDAKLDNISSLD